MPRVSSAAEDGREPVVGGGEGEADHAVEAVVVGDGQGGEPEARRLLGQLLGVAGPVEEREVGVAVELGVAAAAFETVAMGPVTVPNVCSLPQGRSGSGLMGKFLLAYRG